MKDKSEVKPYGRPTFYAVLYDSFRRAALDCGYALALHGSLASDMDMIAVAWVEDAKGPDELAAQISKCIEGTVWSERHIKPYYDKPFGRIVYTMSIMGDWYIDLSVIPPNNIKPNERVL